MQIDIIYTPQQILIGIVFMYVCICKGITDKDIRDAVDNGDQTIKHLKERFAVGSQCGGCITIAKQVLSEQLAETATYYQVA